MNKTYITPEVNIRSCVADALFAVSVLEESATTEAEVLSRWNNLWEEEEL